MHTKPTVVALTLAALTACGPPGGGGGDTSTFVGTFTTVAITSTEATPDVQVSFSGVTIEGLWETPSGWQRVPGQSPASGRFEIASLPASGPIVVRFLNEYFYTTQRALDFSVPSLGRRGTPTVTSSTPVSIAASGMSGWNEGDELQLVAFDSGAMLGDLEKAAAQPPTVGSAQLALDFDYAQQGAAPALITGRAQLAHLTSRVTSASAPYRAIESIATLDDVAMTDGAPLTLNATFQPVSGTEEKLEAVWRRSVFDRFRTVVHPSAENGVGNLEVFALPRAAQYGPYRRGAKLAATQLAENTADSPVSLAFVNPYAGTDLYAEAIVVYARGYGLEGKKRLDIKCGISVSDRLSAFAGEIVPRIGMPRSMTIDGIDGREDVSNVAESPLLAWQPPSFGTADQYVIMVWRLGTNATETTRTKAATLYTQDTSVRVPPGILQAGNKYFVQVIALSTPNSTLATKPVERSFPLSYGAVVSGVLSR